MGREHAAAAAAFRQTLDGLELPPGDLPEPEELGRRAALLAVADVVWKRHLGPVLDGKQAQTLLGVRSRQAVHDLVKRKRLLAVPTPDGPSGYPAFQFTSTGRPHDAMPGILSLFDAAGVSAVTTASWFRTRQRGLDGRTPAAWMAEGRDASRLLDAARRSAARLGR